MRFLSGTQHQVFESVSSSDYHISLESGANVRYFAFFENIHSRFFFDLQGPGSSLEFFGVFIGNIHSQIIASLLASTTFARMYLFCLVKEGTTMEIDGRLFIDKNIESVEAHLKQEQFLFGSPKKLHIRPLLDVSSDFVVATHAAKIYTLDPEQAFYLSSKGLSLDHSQRLIVTGLLQSIFDYFPHIDNYQKQKMFQHILSLL